MEFQIMKIFFSTTPKAKRKYEKEIKAIFEVIKSLGHSLTDDVIQKVDEEDFYGWDEEKRRKYYTNTVKAIKTADVTIFEASYPSLGVGYLISKAVVSGKPVIVLYTAGNKPFMIDSATEDKIIPVDYKIENLKNELKHALDFAKEKNDIRFNFFIPHYISHYLDWIAKNRNLPRSVFLRNLIQKDMDDNDEYQSSME